MVRTDVSEVYGEIGVRLGDLGDARALPLLATAPPGALVDAVRHRLEQPPVPDDPQLTALSAAVGVAGAELGPLWRAVADRPDDLGARTVLGDALVAAGDARGELISLQLAPHDAKRDRRINRLLDAWWEHWLGPIRPLVVRTEFRNGMLEVLHLGRPLIPQRVWDAARGHRELPTVHTVRLHPSSHVQPVEYARFVASLPHLATLEVDAPETLHELGTLTAPRLHTLVYTHPSQRLDVPPVLETFRTFAPGAPALAHITLDPVALGTELDGLVAALPSLFPQLRAIELVAPSRVATRELAERFASAPLVRLTTNR
jgi:hypothetical protein